MDTTVGTGLIDGDHVAASDDGLEVRSPADTSDLVAVFPRMTRADLERAVAAARRAAPAWQAQPGPRRGEILYRAATRLADHSDVIAPTLARESGKTIAEARGEVARATQILRYFAGECSQPIGTTLPSAHPDTLLFTTQEPLGVVAVISPWNFPLAIPLWKIAPALAFGNTVVFRPSTLTPTSGWAAVTALHDAGLPPGVLNFVTGDVTSTGDPLVEHEEVDAVSFTGSDAVGWSIHARAAARGAKVQLELGGKNATVVTGRADLTRAAGIVTNAAMLMAGQKCTATSRVIVTADVADQFLDLLSTQVTALRVGHPLDETTDVGPVITERQRTSVLRRVEQAVAGGAELVTGGAALDGPGFYLQPTVLGAVQADQPVAQEEVFGPVVATITAEDLDHALEVCNGVRYGLSAAIVTRDLDEAMHFARAAAAGVVKINGETSGVEPQAPFGGMKASSSFSREQGKAAADFFTQTKTVYIERGHR